jgi:hypothetical protein
MLVVFLVVAAVVVVIIGLIAVGSVTGRLVAEPRRSVFDLDEAVDYVAERLPDDVTSRLTFDDVRAVIGWHLDYLEEKGVAGESDHVIETLPSGPIVTADNEGIAYVLGRAGEAGVEVTDVEVVEVLEAELGYLRAIGAIGGELPTPRDLDPS